MNRTTNINGFTICHRKTLVFLLSHNHTVLFNIPEQNRTCTTLVPSVVLINYKVLHFPYI